VTIRIAVDIDLFNYASDDKSAAKDSQELAKASNADPLLITRILRHLGAMRIIREVGEDKYVHTRFSRKFLEEPFRDTIEFILRLSQSHDE